MARTATESPTAVANVRPSGAKAIAKMFATWESERVSGFVLASGLDVLASVKVAKPVELWTSRPPSGEKAYLNGLRPL